MTKQRSDRFRFIDLFAGIGGIRLALEEAGAVCVMTSEIDRWARKTYETYFNDQGRDHFFNEDITQIDPADIPDHDILAGGFPCQPFSLAGVSKKNSLGRAHGFDDPTKGTLFFDIKRILMEKKPRAFLLENVKNLRSHDRGKTWRVIEQSLHEAGYSFTDRIINAAEVVPQNRERVFIVGFHRDTFGLAPFLDWTEFWSEVEKNVQVQYHELRKIYQIPKSYSWPKVKYILEPHQDVPSKYTLTPNLWKYLQDYKAKHQALGNGFGFGLIKGDEPHTRTISARYYKDGSEVLVCQGEDQRPRRLTPLECARLQGFPEDFQNMYRRIDGIDQPVSDMQAYKQFGNSVCVPIVTAIARTLTDYLRKPQLLHELPSGEEAKRQLDILDIAGLTGIVAAQ